MRCEWTREEILRQIPKPESLRKFGMLDWNWHRLLNGDDPALRIESLDLVHDPARHLLVGLRDLSGVRGELLDVDTSGAYALLVAMNHSAHRSQTLYDILGVPCGVGADHIKDSYRLLTKKTPLTDGAYAVLTDPIKKQRYDAELWAAARIKPTPEPQWHEASNLLASDRGDIQWRGSNPAG